MKKIIILSAVLSLLPNILLQSRVEVPFPDVVHTFTLPYLGGMYVGGALGHQMFVYLFGSIFQFLAVLSIPLPIYSLMKKRNIFLNSIILLVGVIIWANLIYLGIYVAVNY